jgi:hypothetical protein
VLLRTTHVHSRYTHCKHAQAPLPQLGTHGMLSCVKVEGCVLWRQKWWGTGGIGFWRRPWRSGLMKWCVGARHSRPWRSGSTVRARLGFRVQGSGFRDWAVAIGSTVRARLYVGVCIKCNCKCGYVLLTCC